MALKNRFERIARGEGARPLGFQPLDQGVDAVRFLHVDPAQIQRDPTQPRKDLGELDGLRASIKDQGILQPLIVSPLDDKQYRLIAGERRLTAARQLGLSEVPVLVRGVEEQTRLILQIVENLHRKDLSPIEEAEGVRRLVDESGLSQREAAARLGKSLTYINELLRVLALPDDVIEGVRTSEHLFSKSLLLEITKQPDEAAQRRLWQRARAGGGLTVQQARHHKRDASPSADKKPGNRGNAEADTLRPSEGWTLRTSAGVVTVRLHGGAPQDKKRVRQALEEALQAVSGKPEVSRRRA